MWIILYNINRHGDESQSSNFNSQDDLGEIWNKTKNSLELSEKTICGPLSMGEDSHKWYLIFK